MSKPTIPEDGIWEMPNVGCVKGLNLGKCNFRILYNEDIDISDFHLDKEQEVLVASYPRTGTTWLTQAVMLLQAGEAKIEEILAQPIDSRVPFLEYAKEGSEKACIEFLSSFPTPRVDKTHLSFPFCEKWVKRDKVKVIVTFRNPKDTLVSLYHFNRNYEGLGPFPGTWHDYFKHAQAGKQLYGDQIDWTLGWWQHRHEENVMFVSYEDMKKDFGTELRKIADFLSIQASEKFLDRICSATSFQKMKANKVSNYSGQNDLKMTSFIRSGTIGEWKQYFTVAENEWFDDKYQKVLDESGMKITYE